MSIISQISWSKRRFAQFVALVIVVTATALAVRYHLDQVRAIEQTLAKYQASAANVSNQLTFIDEKAAKAAKILAQYPELVNDGWIRPEVPELFARSMQANPIFYAIYIGFANGGFYELVNLDTSLAVRQQLQALPEDRWVVISLKPGHKTSIRRFAYFDSNFNRRIVRQEPSDYKPYQRHWYTKAGTTQATKSKPYLFQHLQAPGQTYSIKLPNKAAVLAVDITLSSLSDYLKTLDLSQDGEL